MAEPIRAVPATAQAGEAVHVQETAEQSWHAILDELDQAGVLRFVRALVEQRQPLSQQLVQKLDTEPTKSGLKNALEFMMAMGRLPDGAAGTLTEALISGLTRAGEAAAGPEADKMSVWTAMARLKEPDVARAVNYVFGFLEGLGRHLNQNPEQP